MPQPPVLGAVPLDGRPQVQINQMRILEPASLQFEAGGCDRPNAVIKAVLVDLPRGDLMFIPMNIGYAERIHKQLGELIAEHNAKALEK